MDIDTIITPLTVHGPKTDMDPQCRACDLDMHRCPGCGDWLYHGTTCCLQCEKEVRRGER